MQPTLHQHSRATKSNRLINLGADFVDGAHISIGGTGAAIKRAESTNDVTDVRVIDVAIDDVGDDVLGMPALTDFVGGSTSAVIRPPASTLSKIVFTLELTLIV
jgi:hypothetical protein